MRRLIGGLVVGFVGLSLGWTWPLAQAANGCSLSGTYHVDGLGEAGGFLEAVGTLTFTPNPACTSGTVGGAITLRHQGQPPASFTPVGTYSVSPAGAVTLTLPGVIDLVGDISLEGGGTTANSLHLVAAFTSSVVFSVTGTRTPPLVGPQDFTCPPDAVRSGPTCIDKYEASVWQIPAGNTALITKVRQGTVTLADLTAAGFQKGLAVGDLIAAGCPADAAGCKDFYAVSIPGVTPSGFINWFQAVAASRNAGKRLPTNQEWQAAALGTPDPGVSAAGSADCNTANGGGVSVDAVVLTGSRANCVSDVGAFDMVGNLAEWVADWLPPFSGCGAALFAGDFNCLAGTSPSAGTGALVRGGAGFHGGGTFAGVFAVNTSHTPSLANAGNFGFRAAR